jgi:hypothetical protein
VPVLPVFQTTLLGLELHAVVVVVVAKPAVVSAVLGAQEAVEPVELQPGETVQLTLVVAVVVVVLVAHLPAVVAVQV